MMKAQMRIMKPIVLLPVAFFGALFLAACTVQPLNTPDSAFAGGGSVLSSVSVEPVDTRVAQQVRNRLIFLIGGGGSGQPPAYSTALNVNSNARGLLRVDAPQGDVNITAQRVTVTGSLTLTRIADGAVIAEETRSATASFDNTRQEFANIRALRDAEDRAARALAEQLRIVIATALAGV